MKEPESKTRKRLWVYAVVAVCYILVSNQDTFGLPEYSGMVLAVVSFCASFVAGFLFFTSIIPLTCIVVRLVQRKRPGPLVIWSLLLGMLFFFDLTLTRHVFVDFSQERNIRRAQPLIAAIEQYQLDTGDYPTCAEELVPEYIEQLSKPGNREWEKFRYQNLDSTYQISLSLWVGSRTYRDIIYTPTEMQVAPKYVSSDVHDTGFKNWKYYYY